MNSSTGLANFACISRIFAMTAVYNFSALLRAAKDLYMSSKLLLVVTDFVPTPHKVQHSNLSRLRSRADNYLDIYESGYFYYA
ncbi:hypothetical protein pdam_00012781 [Pocillopora damicornis]|uniref:Uncharacterized protein n=1 Tax=Pocillopora damicornis TaxID=46731 RepID=A0A3M6TIW8_POCDA|nr:hypothetical protein pdam_00012781 [Pocillopora damicornis]